MTDTLQTGAMDTAAERLSPSRREPRVFGIPSPWSGNESDAITTAYRVWFFTYRSVRRVRHRLGLHDFHARPLGGDHCDWCGARR